MDAWLKPMMCNPVDEVPTGPDWILEGKIDGWRGVAHVQVDKTVKLFGGRNASDYSGQLPYLEAELAALLPPDTAIDGELMDEAGSWGGVQGAMTRGAENSAKSNPITYVVFDILRLYGGDVRGSRWDERRKMLEEIFTLEDRVRQPSELLHVRLAPYGPSSQESHEAMLTLGLEGSVCKRKDSRYTSGARSPKWVKIKPQATADATVIGFKDGQNGFAGLVGAIEFRLPNGKESRCSGFDMGLRKLMTDNPERYIGRTIEVKHHGETAEGKLRHPQFSRFRDDLDNLSPRERQVEMALQATAGTQTPREKQIRRANMNPRAASGPKRRNYGAMGDAKLLKVRDELQYEGDAYERALERGSGDPAGDLVHVNELIQARGL